MTEPRLAGSAAPGAELVTLALEVLRRVTSGRVWVRVEPHDWRPGDLLITALPAMSDGPVAPLIGWTLMPDTGARLAWRWSEGTETETVLMAARFDENDQTEEGNQA